METWTILLQLVAGLLFLVYYFHRKFSYWSERGVKGPTPWTPFGNILTLILKGQINTEKEWHKKYGKAYGYYEAIRPKYTIVDADLIKQVMVKDFHLFVNRDSNLFQHDIWSLNLFNSEDERWRRIRAITSPSFTTGKLRGMHAMMNRCVDKLGDYFRKVIATENGEMNTKEVITGFTIDVIASTSFATDTNTNDDRSEKNVFLDNSIKLLDFRPWRLLSFFTMPRKFNEAIGNSLGFSDKRFNFFVDMSKAIIKQRSANKSATNGKYQDLVQLMMDAFVYEEDLQNTNYEQLTATADDDGSDDTNNNHKETNGKVANGGSGSIKRTLTENEIIAQIILFFIAGFETTATTITNAMYFLAINPDIQERLKQELDQALEGVEDENSVEYFEKVNNQIPYLDAVIKETLRMCPPVTRLQRKVKQDGYKLDGVPLEKDTIVDIAAYAVHHSDKYYPEPERFNPDRFMPENKHKLVPYTYLPFGVGPRNCIGMRFAYQELRLCLAKISRQFRFEPTEKTQIPPEYTKITLLTVRDLPLRVSAY